MDQAMIAFKYLVSSLSAFSARKSSLETIIKLKYAWYVRMKTSKIGIQEKQD